jgi:hypothetical protein
MDFRIIVMLRKLEKYCIYVGYCWIGIVVRGVNRDEKIDKKIIDEREGSELNSVEECL